MKIQPDFVTQIQRQSAWFRVTGFCIVRCILRAASFLRHPLSLSYGAILPSSLTMLLPPALGFSPHPPVSVYGTGTV